MEIPKPQARSTGFPDLKELACSASLVDRSLPGEQCCPRFDRRHSAARCTNSKSYWEFPLPGSRAPNSSYHTWGKERLTAQGADQVSTGPMRQYSRSDVRENNNTSQRGVLWSGRHDFRFERGRRNAA